MAVEIIKASFTGDALAELKNYLDKRIEDITEGLKELTQTKIPHWRSLYEAQPAESERDFPFPGASNLVIPIVAIHADTIKARAIIAVKRMRPLWPCKVLGDTTPELYGAKDQIEAFLSEEATDPKLLDLFRVYDAFVGQCIRFGTAIIKNPWETLFEHIAVRNVKNTKIDFEKRVIFDAPRPEKIPLENFGIVPSARTVELADFKFHKLIYNEWHLDERAYQEVFDKTSVESIKTHYDREYGSDPGTQQKEADAGVRSKAKQWDIHECWIKYRINDHVVTKLTIWYHKSTRTVLRCVYNTFEEPFVTARLYERDDSFHGYGYAERLEQLQEETSQAHNQRRDARTIENAVSWRVSPGTKLSEAYKIFPSAVIVAEPGEIEGLPTGRPTSDNPEEERLMFEIAERYTGNSSAKQAMGTGSQGKRGVYNTNGVLAMMMEGNSREDVVIGDIRYAHMKLGRMLLRQYAEFGQDLKRLSNYGAAREKILAGLTAVKEGKLGISVQAATASQNREADRQADIMLINLLTRHYGMISQMLTAASNPMAPPEIKEYTSKAITAANDLMLATLRDFDKDDPHRLLPEVMKNLEQQNKPGINPQQQQGNPTSMAGLPGSGGLPQLPSGATPSQP